MPIRFPVGPGTILLCDYSRGGFRPPEMVKRGPAVVISPRLPYRDGLCNVVPLSTTPPPHAVPYVVQLELKPHPPKPFDPGGLRVAWPDQAGAGPRALIYPSKNRAAPKASLPTAQEAI